MNRGDHVNGISGSQPPICSGYSYPPQDNNCLSLAENTINNIKKKSDIYSETWSPNKRNFRMIKTGFQKFERKLQSMIIRQQ